MKLLSRFICISECLSFACTLSFMCAKVAVDHSNTDVMTHVAWPATVACHLYIYIYIC